MKWEPCILSCSIRNEGGRVEIVLNVPNGWLSEGLELFQGHQALDIARTDQLLSRDEVMCGGIGTM